MESPPSAMSRSSEEFEFQGFPRTVHPLELCKILVWGMITMHSMSNVLNGALRKRIHKFPRCRMLAMLGALWWGFFMDDKISKMYSLMLDWGCEMQNVLVETYVNAEAAARESDQLLLDVKGMSDKVTSLEDGIKGLSTKADMARLESDTKADMARLESDMKAEMARLESDTKAEMEEISKKMTSVEIAMTDLHNDVTRVLRSVDAIVTHWKM